jgi:hypothetical protein
MNREQRRQPDKDRHTKTPPVKQPEEASARATSSRHKKSTADKWNQ